MVQPPLSTRPSRWIAPALLLLGSAMLVLAWTLVALWLRHQSSWMAVVVAVDAALLLRWGGMRPGPGRAAWAVGATVATIVLANWSIAATHMGMAVGLRPWESALRLGMHHASTLAGLANTGADLAWMALAVVVAWWMGR